MSDILYKIKDAFLGMNIPNRLTVIRIVLVPIFLLFSLNGFKFCHFIALLIFCGASLTDYYDGKIARRDKLITNFGKFMDPLADKLLTTSAFLVLFRYCAIPGWVWMLTLILAREFIVSGIRLVASEQGRVIAASFFGKLKTVSQMIALIFGLVIFVSETQALGWILLMNACLWISTILCVLSGVDYIKNSYDFLKAQI